MEGKEGSIPNQKRLYSAFFCSHAHLVATVVVVHHDVEDVFLVLREVVDVGIADL